MLIAACGKNERQVALDRIKKIKDADSLYLPENRGKLIDSLIRVYENFIVQFPQDSLVEDMLIQTAGFQLVMGRHQGAIKVLDRMTTQFPDGKLAPDVLLMKGNIYHDQLNQLAEAEKCWKQLVEKFP